MDCSGDATLSESVPVAQGAQYVHAWVDGTYLVEASHGGVDEVPLGGSVDLYVECEGLAGDFLDLPGMNAEGEELLLLLEALVLPPSPSVAMWKVPWPSASMTRLMDREGCAPAAAAAEEAASYCEGGTGVSASLELRREITTLDRLLLLLLRNLDDRTSGESDLLLLDGVVGRD
mmetsp:Transcript_31961/g.58569  ORF Transcript_31961/g.58569 Transcript_31961/m.58569 type:complete len:175 (+) Transcript_31961:273-797(+)